MTQYDDPTIQWILKQEDPFISCCGELTPKLLEDFLFILSIRGKCEIRNCESVHPVSLIHGMLQRQ